MKKLKHLSFTGPAAGRLYCDKRRETDDECIHPFVGGAFEFVTNNRDRICPECLSILDRILESDR
jgi:hypothetical protein